MVEAKYTFSAELQIKVMFEVLKNEKNIKAIAEEYNILPQLVSKWKESFLEIAGLILDENEKGAEEKLKLLCKQNLTPFKHYDLTDTFLHCDGRDVRMEIGVDIIEGKNQIPTQDSQVGINEKLIACIRTLTETEDFKYAIEKMLEIVCKYHNAKRVYILEWDVDETLINNTYEWCEAGVASKIDRLQNIPIETAADWIGNFKEMGSFSISNIKEELCEHSLGYRILEAQGIKSLMAVPLIEGGEICGFLGVDDPQNEMNDFSLLTPVTYFVMNDIQKRKMVTELERLNYIDSLTKLYNRNKYMKDLEQMEKKYPQTLGVVYIDLNGLKVANDKFGHSYGDYLLQQMTKVLNHIFKNNIYRIGGDEFVVLCSNITKNDFEENVIKFRKEVAEGKEISASIGMTWVDKNFSIKNIIKHADDLMYANKQRYYKTINTMDYNRHSSLAKQLIKDLMKERYIVYLQPKISLDSGELSGAEALIRGLDKEGNLVFPDSFIPVYESHGIIRHIDFFVLESVCKLLRDLKTEGKKIGNISVNFSRTTLLEYEVVDNMILICKKYNVDPSNITIEITETTAKLQKAELISLVDKIKKAGFSISLDDYGSEYSNMSILSNIKFDEIKLDKSIVSELTVNEKTRTITQYTIQMLKELKMSRVVAEGIETSEELSIVKQYGCDFGQGYHFSRPISMKQFLHKYFEMA